MTLAEKVKYLNFEIGRPLVYYATKDSNGEEIGNISSNICTYWAKGERLEELKKPEVVDFLYEIVPEIKQLGFPAHWLTGSSMDVMPIEAIAQGRFEEVRAALAYTKQLLLGD